MRDQVDRSSRTDREESFPADPRSVRAARRALRSFLLDNDCEYLVEDGILLLSEVVTNSVVHARTPFRVRMRRDGCVRVDVTDDCTDLPVQAAFTEDRTSGRGMGLLTALAQDHGVVGPTGEDCKTVWFCMPDPRSGAAGPALCRFVS